MTTTEHRQTLSPTQSACLISMSHLATARIVLFWSLVSFSISHFPRRTYIFNAASHFSPATFSYLWTCANVILAGNARVMCYRIRLQSIVEDRMRQLRDAIITCEFETEKEDHAGRCKIIDEWFWEEDFEADNHYTGNWSCCVREWVWRWGDFGVIILGMIGIFGVDKS